FATLAVDLLADNALFLGGHAAAALAHDKTPDWVLCFTRQARAVERTPFLEHHPCQTINTLK
ncbi:MAG: hypothetical protein J6N67_03895, partial [Desulfovibrio sp.]|nr:hypothetical protein [Desulfovibrio sp.]